MMRLQAVFRDIGVPIPINRKVLKINKIICKTKLKKSNRAVRCPSRKLQTVTNVSSNYIRRDREIEIKIYHKKRKTIRVISTQQNRNQTVKENVSYNCKKKSTYLGKWGYKK